jgi:hypothetical protein
MTIRRSILLFFLVLFVGLTLAFVYPYRQLIKETLAEPLTYSLWYLQKVWKSLDSDIIWGSFILIIYVLILLTFPTFRNFPQRSAQVTMINRGSRLEFWLYELRRLVRRQEFSRFSVIELKKLVLDVIAFQEQFGTRQEAENWLMTHEQNVPPEVLTLFDKKTSSRADHTGWSRIPMWRRLWPWKNSHSAPQQQNEESIKAIIQFLEYQFEMHHDHEYR